MFKTILATALVILCARLSPGQEFASAFQADTAVHIQAKLVEVYKIWTPKRHCMRTDLVRYRGHWFCCFQDSNGLIGEKQISIIHSKDGRSWKSAAIIPRAGLPCSRFTAKSNDHLMLFSLAKSADPNVKSRSIGWSSQDGFEWTAFEPTVDGDSRISRMAWHKDRWFGVASGYKTRRGISSLVTSKDGKAFETCDADLPTGLYYEPSIVFSQNNTSYCLLSMLQTVEQIRPHGRIGYSAFPYQKWTWKKLGDWLVDPNLIALPNHRFVVVGRKYDSRISLAFPKLSQITLWSLEPTTGRLAELLTLRSGDELFSSGSPGLAWHDGHLWISYNSSHELADSKTRTRIYLAKVKITEPSGKEN